MPRKTHGSSRPNLEFLSSDKVIELYAPKISSSLKAGAAKSHA